MKYILLASMMLVQIALISGCAQEGNKTPSLAGNTQYPGALPSPNRIQQNNAISAQTMIAPVRP